MFKIGAPLSPSGGTAGEEKTGHERVRITPLAPKFVNRSSMSAEIT
jgi:hypothetical protein